MMRLICTVLLTGMLGACLPFVGSVDGDRFPCGTDDDCAGDGFVCVAGICRDPRDLRQVDAGEVDAAIDDGGSAERGASQDGGDHDASGALDAGPDATSPDSSAVDRVAPDLGAEDGWAEDAAGEDASEDAGPPGPCVSDESCTLTPESFCFAGRCAHLETEAISTPAPRVEAPALSLSAAGQPIIAFFDSIGEDAHLAWRAASGDWASQSLETAGDVGREPALALDPAGDPWVSYRRNDDSTLQLAYKHGAALVDIGQVVEIGAAVPDRAGFAIDGLGRQHLLAYGGVLLYGTRDPAEQPGDHLAPPFALRVARGTTGVSWPALFLDATSGAIYGTYVADNRPHVGVVDPVLGFVSAYVFPRTTEGCAALGLGTSSASCDANRPVDLAVAPDGRVHLCAHIKNTSGQYRVVYIHDDGVRFVGGVFYDRSSPEYDEIGARCVVEVDAEGAAHAFVTRTDAGERRLLHFYLDPAVEVSSASARSLEHQGQGTGYWPDSLLDDQGRLHMVYVRALTPTSRGTTVDIDTSELVYARLRWEDE